jgi:hypothetical protein
MKEMCYGTRVHVPQPDVPMATSVAKTVITAGVLPK